MPGRMLDMGMDDSRAILWHSPTLKSTASRSVIVTLSLRHSEQTGCGNSLDNAAWRANDEIRCNSAKFIGVISIEAACRNLKVSLASRLSLMRRPT